MPNRSDVGGYFDQLTKRGRGGRRLDESETGTAPPAPPAPSAPSTPQSGSRGRLRDTIDKGKDLAKKTSDRVRGRATPTPEPSPRRERDLPSDAIVTVEYTPALDGDPDPGEVVWVWVAFEEDPSQGKDRPVVVIGRRRGSLVGIPLTSKQHDDEAQVNVGTGDWDSKHRTSYARIWRMLDIDPKEMRREGAVLDRARFDQVIAAVDEYYDIKRVETSSGGTRRRTTVENDDF